MVHIPQIQLTIETGDKDISSSTRVFLGLEGGIHIDPATTVPRAFSGREFRCRKAGGDPNPFRSGQTVTLTFGANSDVEKPERNNPTDPEMRAEDVDRVYIRIDPNSRQPWQIKKATVEWSAAAGTSTPRKFELDATTSPSGFIVMDEDGAEKIYLPLVSTT